MVMDMRAFVHLRASVQGRTAEATCSAKSLHRSTDKKFKKRHAVEALIFR